MNSCSVDDAAYASFDPYVLRGNPRSKKDRTHVISTAEAPGESTYPERH